MINLKTNYFNKVLSLTLLFFVFSEVGHSQTLLCSEVLTEKVEEEVIRFEERDLLAFEMVAASIVFRMIKSKVLRIPAEGEIRLQKSQATAISNELYEAFDSLFSVQEDSDPRMTYVRLAERNASNFDFTRLSHLYRSNPDHVHGFLKRNQLAIIENARIMSPIGIRDRFRNAPPVGDLYKRVTYGFMAAGFLWPHAYDFQASLRYLDDYWYIMLAESSGYALGAAVISGSLYLITKPFRSLRVTARSPRYDSTNYDEEFGASIRPDFIDTADYDSNPASAVEPN